MTRKPFLSLASAAALALAAPAAGAAIIVDIGHGAPTSWTDAAGNISAANALTGAAQAFYDTQIGQTMNPNATPVDTIAPVQPALNPDIQVDGREALVMSWNDPGGQNSNVLPVAAWDYMFDPVAQSPVDMSSGSSKIHFSLYFPPGMWDISLELIDAQGEAKGWFLSMPTMPDTWLECWIMVNGGNQNACMLPGETWLAFEQPGFDIDQVVTIRLDEAGRWIDLGGPGAPPIPGGNTGAFDFPVWNAWNHLRVEVPAPASALLLASGLLLLAARARRGVPA